METKTMPEPLTPEQELAEATATLQAFADAWQAQNLRDIKSLERKVGIKHPVGTLRERLAVIEQKIRDKEAQGKMTKDKKSE
jgi:hypothetical protein